MNEKRTCLVCGADISARQASAKTCSDRCRVRAYRMGLASPSDAFQKIVPASLPSRQRKPSVNDIANMIQFAAGLESSLRLAAEKADYRLRPLCIRLADAIGAALDREGLR